MRSCTVAFLVVSCGKEAPVAEAPTLASKSELPNRTDIRISRIVSLKAAPPSAKLKFLPRIATSLPSGSRGEKISDGDAFCSYLGGGADTRRFDMYAIGKGTPFVGPQPTPRRSGRTNTRGHPEAISAPLA